MNLQTFTHFILNLLHISLVEIKSHIYSNYKLFIKDFVKRYYLSFIILTLTKLNFDLSTLRFEY